MAKTCLTKIAGNILPQCIIVPNGVKNIYLMYPEEVTFALASNGENIATAAFASGARSYLIEGYKQNIQITSSNRAMEASTKLDISVSFKIRHSDTSTWRRILMGRFYVMAEYTDSKYYMIGLTSPLECSASEFDSNANGKLVTYILNAPEGSAGNYFTDVETVAKNSIISKSV